MSDFNAVANTLLASLEQMLEELRAAYIFETNTPIFPRLFSRDTKIENGEVSFYWWYVDDTCGPIPQEFELRVSELYEKYSTATITQPILPSEAAIVFKRVPVSDESGKLALKFELAYIQKRIAVETLGVAGAK